MSLAPGRRLLLAGTVFAYLLIGLEILIMISPFALYFYSVYGPVLNALAASRLTGWLPEFFLPHMVFLDDRIILALSYLQLLLVVGLLLFLAAALPLYYGRFSGRGVVSHSFYARIRHPQYLFLAISGLGLLLYWPRFIILVFYVTMLFIYYLLAKNEEWRMRLESPGFYEEYMARTPDMFLPGNPGRRLYELSLGWLKPKWLGIIVAYLLVMGLGILLAMGVRNYTISRLPVVEAGQVKILPVFARPAPEVAELYRRALSGSAEVREFLAANSQVNLVYLMPGDFFLAALVTDKDRRFSEEMLERFPEILEWHQHKFRGGLGKFFRIFYNYTRQLGKVETDYEVERFIFVAVSDQAGQAAGSDHLFDLGLHRRAVLLVDVDAHSHEVLTVIKTSGHNKWGGMPMPTF
jgi:protein-S-isoprenylcysteine O-methyltransferase Ste14